MTTESDNPTARQKTDGCPTARPGRGRLTRETLLLAAVAALVLVVDQFTKHLVLTHIPLGSAWAPIPSLARWFTLTHVSNTGAAFGLFPQLAPVFLAIAIAVAVGIVIYSRYLGSGQYLVAASLGLQLGGALGNLVDRLRVGHVVDFLDFKLWPVFNCADSAIVIGVVLLLWALFWAPGRASCPEAKTRAEGTSPPLMDD